MFTCLLSSVVVGNNTPGEGGPGVGVTVIPYLADIPAILVVSDAMAGVSVGGYMAKPMSGGVKFPTNEPKISTTSVRSAAVVFPSIAVSYGFGAVRLG